MGLGVPGLKRERRQQMRRGLVGLPASNQRLGEVVRGAREVGVDLQRTPIVRDRLVDLPALGKEEPEVAVSFGVLRL